MSSNIMPFYKKILIHISNYCGIATLIAALCYCIPPEENLDPNYQGGLKFSTDTVLFDTLFTTRGSITKRFIVKNPHNNAIKVRSINLGSGMDSPFTITVNGQEGKSFNDIKLMGKDSALMLVKATIDPMDKDLPFLVKDSVVFETNNNRQDIKLISWGQDAHFLGDSVLACNTTWNNDRPYVLFQSILIDSLCTLTIHEGTKIYLSKGASIFVKGSLKVKGRDSARVIFRNDRLDLKYKYAVGQWGSIFFLEGSKDNIIKYAEIRNGTIGIRAGTPDNDTIPDIVLENTIIENMSQSGILAFTSDITAQNCLINNCGEFAVANVAGGNYHYEHCTFANYRFDLFGEGPSVVVSDNFELDNEELLVEDVAFTMQNSIVYGREEDEIVFNNEGNARLEILIAGSLLKTTIDDLDINSNILNKEPKFKNAFNFDYHLDSLSPAIDNVLDIGVPVDLDSVPRDDMPDMGAYEYVKE